MFDALKDMAKLKQMQQALTQSVVTVEKDGVTLVMRGDFEVTDLSLNPDVDVNEQARLVLACLKEAKSQLQAKIAQHMGSFIS